jgi:hypothetical protein
MKLGAGWVTCLDLHNHRRVWRLHNPKPHVYKNEDENTTVQDMYKQVFPEVGISSYKRCRTTIKPHEERAA